MEPRRRRPPFKGYGVPSADEGMLPWRWATERLAAARNYWVATTRPDGSPHSMPVWGVWLDDAFCFGSGSSSAKSRNLAINPKIVVHLESGDETVILEGRAEPVLDSELERRIDEAYAPKYACFMSREFGADCCNCVRRCRRISRRLSSSPSSAVSNITRSGSASTWTQAMKPWFT